MSDPRDLLDDEPRGVSAIRVLALMRVERFAMTDQLKINGTVSRAQVLQPERSRVRVAWPWN